MLKKIRYYRLLFFYIKQIKKHINDINAHFKSIDNSTTYFIKSIQIDKVYRIHTIVNIPENNIKNLQTYGYYFLDNEVKKFIQELNQLLKKYGLFELVGISKADQRTINSVWVIIEFKYLKTTKIARNLILFVISLLIGGGFLLNYFI